MAVDPKDMNIKDREGLKVVLELLELDSEAILIAATDSTRTAYLVTDDGMWRVHETLADPTTGKPRDEIEYEPFATMESVELTLRQEARDSFTGADGLAEVTDVYNALAAATLTVYRGDGSVWVTSGEELTRPLDNEGPMPENSLRACFGVVRAATEWGVRSLVDLGAPEAD